MALSLIAGVILGVSAHRAGLCTVKAVAEVMTSHRGWYLWSFLKASLWTAAILALAGLFEGHADLSQRPAALHGVLGGLLFGLGAGANGACSFSTFARLAEGHAAMALTILGWPVGMAAVGLFAPVRDAATSGHSALPLWAAGFLLLWAACEGARIVRRILAEGLRRTFAEHWTLSLSVAVVAGANAAMLLLGARWSFTTTALCASGIGFGSACASQWALWGVTLAALAGMVGSALLRRSFRLRPIRRASAVRHGMAGIVMGAGAALMPGGNDGLILFGLPAVSPHAPAAWGAIVAGIALALSITRALGRPLPVIRCDADICRASL